MELRALRYIKKNFEYRSYLETHCDLKPSSAGSVEMRICCPLCLETDYKCYVNDDKKMFHCHKCELKMSEGKDVFDFVAAVECITRGAAIMRLLTDHEFLTPDDLDEWLEEQEKLVEPQGSHKRPLVPIKLPEPCIKMTRVDAKSLPFWKYLHDRGFTHKEVTDYNLHYVPAKIHWIYHPTKKDQYGKPKRHGNIGLRIFWPVYAAAGMVSWVARTIDEDTDDIKYLNRPDTDISQTLYPHVRPKSDSVVLVEGNIDAQAVRRLEDESAYGTFGKHVTEEQMDLLLSWGVTSVTLWWDKSDARPQMIKAVKRLKMRFPKVSVACQRGMEDEKGKPIDPGDTLALTNGLERLKEGIIPIDVDSIDYMRWCVE